MGEVSRHLTGPCFMSLTVHKQTISKFVLFLVDRARFHTVYNASCHKIWYTNRIYTKNTTYIANCDHIYGFMWRKRIAADCKSFRERERERLELGLVRIQIRIWCLNLIWFLFVCCATNEFGSSILKHEEQTLFACLPAFWLLCLSHKIYEVFCYVLRFLT